MFHTPAHKQTDPAQQVGQLSPAKYTPAKPTDYHSVYGQQKYRDLTFKRRQPCHA